MLLPVHNFHEVNDRLVARRDALDAEIAARSDYRDSLPDPVHRAIGQHFTRQEARAARVAHLGSLAQIVDAMPPGSSIDGASHRALAALARARVQRNFSAYEALERELDRDRADEEHMLMLILAA